MAETTEIIVSAFILFFVLLGIYYKFLKEKLTLPVFAKTALGKFKGGKIKKPKITLGRIILLIILILILYTGGSYLYRDNVPVATYGFSSTENLSINWNITSEIDNLKVQNRCLIGSGEIQLKNPNVIAGWRRIEFVPAAIGDSCGTQKLELSFRTGEIISQYGIKTAKELGENKEGSYHTAGIFYKAIGEEHLLSSPSKEYIKPDESAGPYPVGIRRALWWDFMTPKYTVYVLNDNSPIKEQVLAYTGTSGMPGTYEGKLAIIMLGGSIKEVKIYK